MFFDFLLRFLDFSHHFGPREAICFGKFFRKFFKKFQKQRKIRQKNWVFSGKIFWNFANLNKKKLKIRSEACEDHTRSKIEKIFKIDFFSKKFSKIFFDFFRNVRFFNFQKSKFSKISKFQKFQISKIFQKFFKIFSKKKISKIFKNFSKFRFSKFFKFSILKILKIWKIENFQMRALKNSIFSILAFFSSPYRQNYK